MSVYDYERPSYHAAWLLFMNKIDFFESNGAWYVTMECLTNRNIRVQ